MRPEIGLLMLLVVTGIVAIPKEPRGAYIELYERRNQGGQYVSIQRPTPYLSSVNFDNRASSFCVKGIFLLHESTNFNSNNLRGAASWAWSENVYCNNLDSSFDNRASSVRYSGDRFDTRKSTINFYRGEGFNGREHFYYSNAQTLTYDNEGSSIIVTGCEPWTLYQYDYYEGRSLCIYPDSSCRPGFYPLRRDLNGFDDIVSSVRRGCFSNKVAHPTLVAKEGETFVTGSFNG